MRKVLLLCVFVAAVFAVQAAAQCPTITVKGPAGIANPGDNVVFEAEINVVGPKLSYSWSADKGTIIEGQGTTKIIVFADPRFAGGALTATVTIDGLPETCQRTASECAGIAELIPCGLPEEWGDRMKPNDERGRLDMFFAELTNNPTHVGIILFRVGPNEKLDLRNSRIRFVLKHAKFRGFDKSRLSFLLERSDEKLTRLYRLLPGTETPRCEGCLIFKGEHL